MNKLKMQTINADVLVDVCAVLCIQYQFVVEVTEDEKQMT
jgi:hypothetical protein